MEGTITWIPEATGFPPKDVTQRVNNVHGNYSIEVLITDGLKVDKSCYFHYDSGGGFWHTYTPTHWAYINLPE